jgi:hypothetical protein
MLGFDDVVPAQVALVRATLDFTSQPAVSVQTSPLPGHGMAPLQLGCHMPYTILDWRGCERWRDWEGIIPPHTDTNHPQERHHGCHPALLQATLGDNPRPFPIVVDDRNVPVRARAKERRVHGAKPGLSPTWHHTLHDLCLSH